MKPSTVLAAACLVVGLAAGGLVGFLVGSSKAPDVGDSTSARPTAPDAAAPSTDEPAPAPRKPPHARGASGDAPDSSKLDAPPPTGDGTITGFVRATDGTPLAGAVVRAAPYEEDDDSRPVGGGAAPDLDAETKRRVDRLLRDKASTREATTDAAGAYSITGLADEPRRVNAWLAGWRIARADGNEWKSVKVGGSCDFKATRVAAVRIAVLMADGTSPETARVEYRKAASTDFSATTWRREAQQIDLEPGSYEFTATAGPQKIYRSEPQTATVTTDAATEVTLRVVARQGLLVRVTYASPKHPRNVRVAALKLDAGASADPARLLAAATKSKWLEEGYAETALTDLTPGNYLVGLTFRGGTLGPTTTAVVGADVVSLELRVTAGDLRDWVKLWVRGPDGAPVHDVEIISGWRGPDGGAEGDVDASAEADGSFRVEHYEDDAPPLGHTSSSGGGATGETKRTYFVRARSGRFGEEETTYDPAVDAEVSIRFAEAARLSVAVAGFAETPGNDRLSVSLASKSPRVGLYRGPSLSPKIGPDGAASFPAVKPGAYVLTLSRAADPGAGAAGRSRNRDDAELARVELTLLSGVSSQTIAVPTTTELVVAFDGGAPAQFELQRSQPDGSTRAVSGGPKAGDREFAYPDLVPGRYRLVAKDVGDMWTVVPGDARVVFRPRPFNACRLVVGEKGYLAELGLKTGDVLVAFDGVEFKDQFAMAAALAGAKARESARLSIVRGERAFDVAADGRRLAEVEGGAFDPWVR